MPRLVLDFILWPAALFSALSDRLVRPAESEGAL
jgi:hypothetical protein